MNAHVNGAPVPTEPDLYMLLASILDAPGRFRIYALRAQPIADSDPQPGDTAPRSYIWEDGKPTDRLDIGTGAILWFTVEDAREIAKSSAVQVPLARKFRRAFNLLRQYALIHADESPQRLYRFVLLGADTACTSGEDFEVNVVNPTVLYSCVLGCVAPAKIDRLDIRATTVEPFVCKTCNGTMTGDGYTRVYACEHIEDTSGYEPDAGPLYCTMTADHEVRQ